MSMNAPIESIRKEIAASRSNYAIAREIASVLWRRKVMIASVSMTAMLLGAITTRFIESRYVASAVVQVDLGGHDAAQFNFRGDVIASTTTPISIDAKVYVESFARLIQTEDVARRVVERLGLDKVPPQHSFLHPLVSVIGKVLWGGSVEQPSPVDLATRRFMDNLTVTTDTKSYLITVTYTAPQPEQAARIANAVVSEGLRMQQIRTRADRLTTAQRALADLSATYGPKHPLIERTQEYLSRSQMLSQAEDLRAEPMSEVELFETGHVVPAHAYTIRSGLKRAFIIAFFLCGLISAIGSVLFRDWRDARP